VSVQLKIEKTLRVAKESRDLRPLVRERCFSQYGEDALIFAALNPTTSGFYVDVGAHNPTRGSNTYRLYRFGWSGITIEPNPDPEAKFKRLRPRDKHLNIGVSQAGGELLYHHYANSVFNTFSSTQVAKLSATGLVHSHARTVQTRPLADILSEHASGRHIDFMSVDCEGFDLEVLRSSNIDTLQPTAVLVEDVDGYHAFQNGRFGSETHAFMADHGYRPMGQALLSTLYISVDWRQLFAKTSAFHVGRIQESLFP